MRSRKVAFVAVGLLAGLGMASPSLLQVPVAPASAQGLVTAAVVASGLVAAIDGLKAAIAQAGDEFRATGNSLQANAQSVLLDLNTALKDRMNQAVTALDAQERRLAEDAEALTRQVTRATQLIIAGAGEEARRTIADADILAYNTLYSLPCRSQRPRVVAAFPGEIIVAQSEALLTLRGNFLDQGSNVTARIGDHQAEIVERLATTIRIRIPGAVAPPSVDSIRTVSVSVAGLEAKNRSLWVGLICREQERRIDPVLAALTIKPQITHSVRGTLRTLHMVETQVVEPQAAYGRMGSDRCEDDFPVSTTYCTTRENAVGAVARFSVESANCGSGVESVQASGPRCSIINGRIKACGANRIGTAWAGCKGRGWLNYNVNLEITTSSRVPAGTSEIIVEPSVAERSWVWRFPGGQTQPTYEYEVTVVRSQGTTELGRWTLSGANPNSGPFKSRVADGALAVEIEE